MYEHCIRLKVECISTCKQSYNKYNDDILLMLTFDAVQYIHMFFRIDFPNNKGTDFYTVCMFNYHKTDALVQFCMVLVFSCERVALNIVWVNNVYTERFRFPREVFFLFFRPKWSSEAHKFDFYIMNLAWGHSNSI